MRIWCTAASEVTERSRQPLFLQRVLWPLHRVNEPWRKGILLKYRAVGESPLSPTQNVREDPLAQSRSENNRPLPGTPQQSALVGTGICAFSFLRIQMAMHFPSRSFHAACCQNQAMNLEVEPEELSIYVSTVWSSVQLTSFN